MPHTTRRVEQMRHLPDVGTPGMRKPRFHKQVGAKHSIGQGKFSRIFPVALVFAFALAFALIVIVGHVSGVAAFSSNTGITNDAGYGSLNHPKGSCGNAGQAPCPSADPGWFAVPSVSPASVEATIVHSKMYSALQNRFGFVSYDTPALVHAYNAHTGNDYYDDDHWVVSVRDSSGLRCGILDFVYDSAHARMRFSSYGVVSGSDPHSRQAFPYVPAATAIAQLQHQRGLRALQGTSPELIFFPIDPRFPYLSSPVHQWSGGGNSAMNPMWRIMGSDKQAYFVGEDMRVYLSGNLPIAPQGQP